jgi:transcription-repair coupling factor (superfamily II helicase)
MDLPKLTPGKRYTVPRPAGSADALFLARLAQREQAAQRVTAIVTSDATRCPAPVGRNCLLRARLALHAVPRLGNPALRQFLTPPGFDQRTPGHTVAHRRRAADVVLVPATTALVPLGAPSVFGGLHLSLQGQAAAGRGQTQGSADAGRLQPCDQVVSPGEYAVRGGLIDLFPMGSPRALPCGPV